MNTNSEQHWPQTLRQEMSKVLIGQDELVDSLLLSLLTQGHVLLEGAPGLAKTLAVKTLAQCLDVSFSRLQFTPDLLPADLIGTLIYNPEKHSFEPKLGPIFSQFILADEINRAPAKVQSALLEAMQEKQVTLGETTHKLPSPFLVLATQNPIDQEGTYPLPEAQLDRFLFKIIIDYPSLEEEMIILEKMATSAPQEQVLPVVSVEELHASRLDVDKVHIDNNLNQYIVELVQATRDLGKVDAELGQLVRAGASPRASIQLALSAKALAYLEGRDYVIPQDIKKLAHRILRHRILLSYEAEAQDINADQIITSLLSKVQLP